MFAKYDVDGDRVLDEREQRRMQADLEGQKVRPSPRAPRACATCAVAIHDQGCTAVAKILIYVNELMC